MLQIFKLLPCNSQGGEGLEEGERGGANLKHANSHLLKKQKRYPVFRLFI